MHSSPGDPSSGAPRGAVSGSSLGTGGASVGWALVICLLLASASSGANPYRVATFEEDGRLVDKIIVPGRPPLVKARAVSVPVPNKAAGINTLAGVPAFTWCYGCSATSAGMIVGYYDRNGYGNMYAGPANGGVCPLNNETYWGHTSYPGVTCGECPLVATHEGKDGRTSRGHVDDYWIDYMDPGPDPYIVNHWTEHVLGDCTADYMGTNQSKYGSSDGSTTFYFTTHGSALHDYTECEPGGRDGCHGMKLFVDSRGYTVSANFSQYIYGYEGRTQGFTYSDFKTEIDAGRPVMIQVEGHSMVGYGYNDTGSIVYIHDTWDNGDHSMTWGGSYSGMEHFGVTVLRLGAVLPVVTVTATDATAGEPGSGAGTGTFTFSRTGSTAATLAVNYSVTGTATSGSDYVTLGASVTFTAGSATAIRTVSVLDDSQVEGDETVVVTLSSGAGYTVGSPASATVTIKDDDQSECLVVDDADSGRVTYVGTWTQSSWAPGYWGAGYKHDGNAGKGAKSVTFRPNLPATATYSVSLRWTSGGDRAGSVPVDIAHSGGQTTVYVNQRLNGGMWNVLGTYTFAAGTGGYVRIRTTDTAGFVIADAVQFCGGPPPATPTIARSPVSLAPSCQQGQNAASQSFEVWNSGGGTLSYSISDNAGWLAVSPASGTSTGEHDTIQVSYTTAGLAVGTHNATITIAAAGASNTPQTIAVTLTVQPGQVPVVVDDNDPSGVTWAPNREAWMWSDYVKGYWGTGYRHDGNTGKGNKSVEFRPNLPASGSYSVSLRWTANGDRAGNVPVDILHAGGVTTVYVNQKLNGGVWNLLGTFTFAAGTGGYVRMRTTATTGFVIADAVQFAPATGAGRAMSPLGRDALEGRVSEALDEVSAALDTDTTDVESAGEDLVLGCEPGPLGMRVSWPTREGMVYTLLHAPNLAGPWEALTDMLGDGELAVVDVDTAQSDAGFLRVEANDIGAPDAP